MAENLQHPDEKPINKRLVALLIVIFFAIGVGIAYITTKRMAKSELSAHSSSENLESSNQALQISSENSSISNQAQITDTQTKLTLTQESVYQSSPNELEKLKELLKEKDELIQKLNQKLSQPNQQTTPSINHQLKKLPKISSFVVDECTEFEIGKWETPKSCKEKTLKKIQELLAKNSNILIFEVIPRVDTIAYQNDKYELKQNGLAVFRAINLKEQIDKSSNKELLIFYSRLIQEPNKRGYILKAYTITHP